MAEATVTITEADVRRAVGELLNYGERLVSPQNLTAYRIPMDREAIAARLCDLLGLAKGEDLSGRERNSHT